MHRALHSPRSLRVSFVLALGLACIATASWVHKPPVLRPSSLHDDYALGLQVWRKPGKDNVPCAFCHSPDGIEIAAFSFSDDTIRRRARPHLGTEDAEQLVKFVHAVRAKYGFTTLLDPMVDRPLQPTGAPLPGATAEERDEAFRVEVERRFPALTAAPITSREVLDALASDLAAFDPLALPVGIEFNRLSEDKFHGPSHATIANWFADVPFLPVIPWDIIFGVQDQYLQDPTPKNLSALLDTGPERMLELSTPADQAAVHKFNSLVIYQHLLRTAALGRPANGGGTGTLLEALGRPYVPNPIWDLGEFAALYADIDLKSFHLPEAIAESKTGGYSAQEQLAQIRPGWLWGGWLLDQGFLRNDYVRLEEPTPPRRTRVLTSALVADGPYLAHALYAMARKAVVRSVRAPEADYDLGILTPATVDRAAPGRRVTLRRMFANVMLVGLRSAAEAKQQGKPVPAASQRTVAEAAKWIGELQPDSATLANEMAASIK